LLITFEEALGLLFTPILPGLVISLLLSVGFDGFVNFIHNESTKQGMSADKRTPTIHLTRTQFRSLVARPGLNPETRRDPITYRMNCTRPRTLITKMTG
jgi:hypothetical protein